MTEMTHLEESCNIWVNTLIIGTRFTFLCLFYSSGFWPTWLASVFKVSVVAAYLSQDQYQKRVESMSRLSPHAPESMTRPMTWKYGFNLTCTQPSYGLSLDCDLNELVSTNRGWQSHERNQQKYLCAIKVRITGSLMYILMNMYLHIYFT